MTVIWGLDDHLHSQTGKHCKTCPWPFYFQMMVAIKTDMSERMVIVVSLNQQFLSPALISSQGLRTKPALHLPLSINSFTLSISWLIDIELIRQYINSALSHFLSKCTAPPATHRIRHPARKVHTYMFLRIAHMDNNFRIGSALFSISPSQHAEHLRLRSLFLLSHLLAWNTAHVQRMSIVQSYWEEAYTADRAKPCEMWIILHGAKS